MTEIGARDFGDANRYNMLEVGSRLNAATMARQTKRGGKKAQTTFRKIQ